MSRCWMGDVPTTAFGTPVIGGAFNRLLFGIAVARFDTLPVGFLFGVAVGFLVGFLVGAIP